MALSVEAVRNSTTWIVDELTPIPYSQDDRKEIVRNINDLVKERKEGNHEVVFFEYSPIDETYHFRLYGHKELTILKKNIYAQNVERSVREFFSDISDRMQDSMPCGKITIIDGVFHRVFTGSDRVHWGVYNRVFTTSIPPYEEHCVHSKLPHKVVHYLEGGVGVIILDIFISSTFKDLKDKYLS